MREQISNRLQMLNKTVLELRWLKLVFPSEYCWKIGIVVKLSFSINGGTAYLVLLKCLLAELIAEIIHCHQCLLLPLIPVWKQVFDSSLSCVAVPMCSVVSRLILLSHWESSWLPGSLSFLSSVSLL